MNPLILTLALDQNNTGFFNDLRQKYFPPERNFIDAHLTLFHHLQNSPDNLACIQQTAAQSPAFALAVVDVILLGAGVAYLLKSEELIVLHGRLQQKFAGQLTRQDQQKLRAHITIQNKVTVKDAKQLHNTLKTTFEPFNVTATGLQVWEYLGGPWKFVAQFDFAR